MLGGFTKKRVISPDNGANMKTVINVVKLQPVLRPNGEPAAVFAFNAYHQRNDFQRMNGSDGYRAILIKSDTILDRVRNFEGEYQVEITSKLADLGATYKEAVDVDGIFFIIVFIYY